MKDTNHSTKSLGALAKAGLLAGVLAGLLAAGCHDPRISLQEFIELQEELELASAPTAQPSMDQDVARQLIDEKMGPYKVGPGDVIAVLLTEVTGLVSGTSAVPTRVRVNRDGEVILPLVGALKVAGLELEDIEALISDAYVPKVYREASVHVMLSEADPTEVLIRGAVAAPGLIQLRRTERNLLYAVVAAGGVTQGSTGRVMLQRIRRPGSLTELNIATPDGLRQALREDPLEDGDILVVESAAPNTYFVGGLVNVNGPQAYPPGTQMTILQVLAAAGGLRTDILIEEATLTRRLPDGRDIRVKLDVNRLADGRDPNFYLASGDILWVNHTVSTWIQDWINSHIFIRGGVSASATYSATGVEYLNSNAREQQALGDTSGSGLESSFDPFGFLQRGALLNQAAGGR